MQNLPPDEAAAAPTISVCAIKFRYTGQVYKYDAGTLPLRCGDHVIVHGDRGNNMGTVVIAPHAVPAAEVKSALPRVIKKADPRDLAREESNQDRARDAQRICVQRINERRLPMKLVKADCLFDGSRIVFYFFAEDRIDFRDLVRDLAQALHTRVEMKQIGARDETKLIGGVGPCGRELCCSSWLREFRPVSVKMAKEQGLSLNPSKLAGMCGRLKCCLRYEYDTYLELGRALPSIGSTVESVKGNGVVTRHHVLRQTVIIRGQEGAEVEATLDDLVQKKALT
jgi:cell fate regulator YaaT (PSP1 superfamily)